MRQLATKALIAIILLLAETASADGLASDLLFRRIPYAEPVPGKPGFVFLPVGKYKGLIDVRGFTPGTEVKDPYTGQVFLVPKPATKK